MIFLSMDITKGVPWATDSVSYIFSSHMIEHITYREAERFLKECHRILKPGGVMRIAVPDTEILVKMYQEKRLKELNAINEPAKEAKYDLERFHGVITYDHKAFYDWETMRDLCLEAGFSRVERKSFKVGHPVIVEETEDLFPEISLYVEIAK